MANDDCMSLPFTSDNKMFDCVEVLMVDLDVLTRCVRKEATDLTGCCSGIERQDMARQRRAEEGREV